MQHWCWSRRCRLALLLLPVCRRNIAERLWEVKPCDGRHCSSGQIVVIDDERYRLAIAAKHHA